MLTLLDDEELAVPTTMGVAVVGAEEGTGVLKTSTDAGETDIKAVVLTIPNVPASAAANFLSNTSLRKTRLN